MSASIVPPTAPQQLHFRINLPDSVLNPDMLQGGSIAYKFLCEMRIALKDTCDLLGAGEPSFTTTVVYPGACSESEAERKD